MVNQAVEKIRKSVLSDGVIAQPRLTNNANVDLLEWGRLIRAKWKLIALCTCLPLLAMLLVTSSLMTSKWSAIASLRPVTQQSQMLQLMGQLPGSIFSVGGSIGSLFDVSSELDEAQEYTSILESYDFTVKLVETRKLEGHLLKKGPGGPLQWIGGLLRWLGLTSPVRDRNWQLYEIMTGRFDCRFNDDSGNLELSFIDADPKMAKTILEWYVDGLREVLRKQIVDDSGKALLALRMAAQSTTDVYLQGQLYQLTALQLQGEKLAEAESDFAFKTVQSPVVPARPYSPRPLLDAGIAGFAGFGACVLCILLAAWIRRLQDEEQLRHLHMRSASAEVDVRENGSFDHEPDRVVENGNRNVKPSVGDEPERNG